MINEIEVKKYCKEEISKIKNYDKAIADTTQTWHCHHILGEILSKEQLEAHDFYYNVPACMLKFVTKSEHRSLHNIHQSKETRKKKSEALKNRQFSEESRKKMSESNKGRIPWNKGIARSEETRKKISEKLKGMTWKLIDGKRVYFPKEVK